MTASSSTNDVLSSDNYISKSSQFTKWTFTQQELADCRKHANFKARQALLENARQQVVEHFAATDKQFMETEDPPSLDANGNEFLNVQEEAMLVSFYGSKLLGLVGPMAQLPRLRREAKVVATASMLYRRFFMSNSVMMFDPKAIMVASAFLATKVEDCMADVRHMQEGTTLMKSTVETQDILSNELFLLSGIDFDLTCVHPYKAVLALTEDLRTFLKSDKGRTLATFEDDNSVLVSGQDLKPMHDMARTLMDDVIVSDIPLLIPPGQVGLAALMLANHELLSQDAETRKTKHVPKIDFHGYLLHLASMNDNHNIDQMEKRVQGTCQLLRGLKDGLHGCGNHNIDLVQLKQINKKLKKCKALGKESKKKKRKLADKEQEEPAAKKPRNDALTV